MLVRCPSDPPHETHLNELLELELELGWCNASEFGGGDHSFMITSDDDFYLPSFTTYKTQL